MPNARQKWAKNKFDFNDSFITGNSNGMKLSIKKIPNFSTK